MAKLKKIRVREAKARDIGLFRKLWIGLLEKQAKLGAVAVPSEQTLSLYENVFNAYLEGTFEGIVLFVADRGVLMWGDQGVSIEYPDRTITAWGLHVDHEEPEMIEKALQERAREWATERGFKSVLMTAPEGSEVPEGFKPVATVLYGDLDD